MKIPSLKKLPAFNGDISTQESSVNITSKVENITPEKAEAMLARNAINRRLKDAVVRLYAEQMKRGCWHLNGEPIIIGDDGSLHNGQHRLRAVIEFGGAVKFLVVSGVSGDAIETIDTGSSRTAADVLTMHGLETETAVASAAAARILIAFYHYGTGSTSMGRQISHLCTNQQIHEFVEAHPQIVDYAETLQGFGRRDRPIPLGKAVFLYFLMSQQNEAGTEEFFQGFFSGAGLDEFDPRLVVRKRISADNATQRRSPERTRMSWAIRAWKWHIEGRQAVHATNLCKSDPDSVNSAFKWLLPNEGAA